MLNRVRVGDLGLILWENKALPLINIFRPVLDQILKTVLKYAQTALCGSKFVDPWSECLDPSYGGGVTSPLPPSAGQPRRWGALGFGGFGNSWSGLRSVRPSRPKT